MSFTNNENNKIFLLNQSLTCAKSAISV